MSPCTLCGAHVPLSNVSLHSVRCKVAQKKHTAAAGSVSNSASDVIDLSTSPATPSPSLVLRRAAEQRIEASQHEAVLSQAQDGVVACPICPFSFVGLTEVERERHADAHFVDGSCGAPPPSVRTLGSLKEQRRRREDEVLGETAGAAGALEGSIECGRCSFANADLMIECEMCSAPLYDDSPSAPKRARHESRAMKTNTTATETSIRSATGPVDARGKHLVEVTRADAHPVDGLVELLEAAYGNLSDALQKRRPRHVLCGPTTFFSQRDAEGAAFSCGYRNIQMLCSALMRVPVFRGVLFNGVGYVPDVPSLQGWIERAWALGFDVAGAEQLGGSLVGSTKWIGTTECAALLRSFRIPAEIVQFEPGPGVPQGPRFHEAMMKWAWEYFATPGGWLKGREPVDGETAFPLYMQYDGHSVLAIGVERRDPKLPSAAERDRRRVAHDEKQQKLGQWFGGGSSGASSAAEAPSTETTQSSAFVAADEEWSLLRLDPQTRAGGLISTLRQQRRWERLVKWGLRRLQKPAYQFVVVRRRELLTDSELERAKVIEGLMCEQVVAT